ncbi:hypothetical protein M408DRAFT_27932 [Serendipita vermifera MAFF 305830]|uniref:F-box domain-containing protein n=1 Tax=Serendipita vermifera MAFF 305830 TaxID=933852 RepID=A0A0C3ATM2_SERVB|nr:hypothetical protein M408DRAFT_27932 [Serendipita vermifera MAFF 305830]
MSATSSLSVELWQTILRYAIGVADFLDPDAFEGVVMQHLITDTNSSKNDETAYWYAERTRNTLQLVSKTWNTYLCQFEHRFVRMLDIWHEKLDPTMLRKAVRISFSRYHCRCSSFCYVGLLPNPPATFREFCWKTLDAVNGIEMEIADMVQEEHRIADLVTCIGRFQNVKTFIGPSCTYSGRFSLLIDRLPKVRHFYGKGFWGTREHSKPSSVASDTIVTLSFHSRKGGNYHSVAWNLPFLRYLRFKDDSDEPLADFIANAVMPLMKAVGSHLRALYLYHRVEELRQDIPKELWDLCPQLETLRTGMSLTFPPPFFHPIHTLIVCNEDQMTQIDKIPEWPNLKKMVIDLPWRWVGEGGRIESLESRETVRVEDRDGFTVHEYKSREGGSTATIIDVT